MRKSVCCCMLSTAFAALSLCVPSAAFAGEAFDVLPAPTSAPVIVTPAVPSSGAIEGYYDGQPTYTVFRSAPNAAAPGAVVAAPAPARPGTVDVVTGATVARPPLPPPDPAPQAQPDGTGDIVGFPAIQPGVSAIPSSPVVPMTPVAANAVAAPGQPNVVQFVVPVPVSPYGYVVAPAPDYAQQQYDAAAAPMQQQQFYAAQPQGQMLPGQNVRQFPPDQIVPPQPPQQLPGYPAAPQGQAYVLPAQPQQIDLAMPQPIIPVPQPVPAVQPVTAAVPVAPIAPIAPAGAGFAHPMPPTGYAATLGTPVAGRENLSIVRPAEVREALARGVQLIFLDVRDELVRDIEGHIAGDAHVSFGPAATFSARVRRVIPGAAYPVVVYCSDGIWSSQAADVMARMGYRVYLMGAYPLWLRG